MKKFISMLLVLVMLSTSVSTTLAVSYSEDIEASAEVNRIVDEYSGDTQKKGQLKKMVSEDLELLKKANLTSQVDIFDISDNGEITYAMPITEEVTDYITVREEDTGDLILNISEGDIQNTLVYKKNGEIILDGHKVELVPQSTEEEVETLNEEFVSLDAVRRGRPQSRVFAITLPINKSKTDFVIPSNFTHLKGNDYASKAISVGEYLIKIAAATLLSVAIGMVSGGVGGVMAILATAAAAAIQEAYNAALPSLIRLQKTYPNEKYISFTCRSYAKNGNDSFHSEWIYSYAIYANTAYRGIPALAASKKVLETL